MEREQIAKAIDVKCPVCGSGPRTVCGAYTTGVRYKSTGKRITPTCKARVALARRVTSILTAHFYLVEEPCPGEAHKNPYIDNCMVCAPRWGTVMRLHPKEI